MPGVVATKELNAEIQTEKLRAVPRVDDTDIPMLKMIVINWRKPGITLEDFNQHGLVKHGPLFKEHAKARCFVRYVQSHNLPNAEIEAFAEQRGK
jgi:hypothetical protein